ncbi:MAG: hypothetical protein CMM86_03500 [Rhodovulum sp.]|nr:hypothetical protein [Rhodovulum sp.]|tara:strand:+ start:16034 stop:17887 length:1854 start_codon:yes stop_codon:yes gene_type:complete
MLNLFHFPTPFHSELFSLERFFPGIKSGFAVNGGGMIPFNWMTKIPYHNVAYEKFFVGPFVPHLLIFLVVPVILCFCAYYEKQAPYYTYSTFAGFSAAYVLFFAFLSSSYALVLDNEALSYDSLRGTQFADILSSVIILFSLFSVLISIPYIQRAKVNTHEFYSLFLISCVAMLSLLRVEDFITMYLCIELQALCFYILAAYRRTSLISVEAGLKYFSLSAMASGILLFGITGIYYSTGSTNFDDIYLVLSALVTVEDSGYTIYPIIFGTLFVLAAFLFKLPAAPFHMWAADVYEGSPTASTSYFLSVPKFALFGIITTLLFKVFSPVMYYWQPALLFISAISLFVGYFSALGQNSIKRFFVYSGVSHVGFMLLAISSPEGSSQLYNLSTSRFGGFEESISDTSMFSLFFYLFAYTFMILSAMIFIMMNSNGVQKSTNRLTHYGVKDLPMFHTNAYYSFLVLFLFFSFIGVPPTLGFFSKFFVLKDSLLWSSSLLFFGILFIMITLTGFVYGRLIAYMFFKDINLNFPRHWWSPTVPSRIWSRMFTLFVILTMIFFVYPNFIMDLVDILCLSFSEDNPLMGENHYSKSIPQHWKFYSRSYLDDEPLNFPWAEGVYLR